MKQWILDRWLAYARMSLMLAVFLAPVAFWRGTVDVFNLVKMTILLVAGACALLFWISWSAEAGIWMPRFNLLYAALAFIAAGVLATVLSENPFLSLTGLYHRYGGLIPFALYVGVMVLIVGMYWERPNALRDIAKASAAASIILTAYALIQESGKDWIQWTDASGNPPLYPVSTMGNSNFAGGYLGIAFPFLVYMTASAKKGVQRYLLMLAVAADLFALWFTQTRGGMIAAGAGTLTMVFLYRDRLPRWMRLSTLGSSIVVAVLAVVVLADLGGARSSGPLGKIEVLRTGTFSIRTFYWGTAWRIFADNPVAGTGLDTYFANYPKYRLEEDGSTLGLTITDKPHNIFLEYAANSGIVGAGTYLLTVGMGLWFGVRRARKLEGNEKLLLTTFTGVLAGYLAQGVFSIDVPPLAIMGWVALGGIAAIADPAVVVTRDKLLAEAQEKRKREKRSKSLKGQKAQRRQVSGPTRWPVHGVGVLVVGALLFFGLRPLMADAAAKTAEAKLRAKASPEEVNELFKQAIDLHPLEPSYRVQSGSIAEQQASNAQDPKQKIQFLKIALDRYLEAYRLQPGNVFYMMNLGRIYATWGEIDKTKFAKSDEWWGRAARHDPTDYEVHNRYALMLNGWANADQGNQSIRRKAAAELEKVVELRPDQLDAWINLAKVYVSLGDRAKATRAAEAALKLDPGNQEASGLLQLLQSEPPPPGAAPPAP